MSLTPDPATLQALQQAARDDEQAATQDAILKHLQARTTALNLEVRLRDARIAELEQELADARREPVLEEPVLEEQVPEEQVPEETS